MEHYLKDFNHRLQVQIRFNDIDGLGHVNNVVYQEYFDLGRSGYLKSILGDSLGTDDKNLVIVSYKTDFFKPSYINDKLIVLTRVYKLGVKSIKMIQWIIKDGNVNPCVTCDSVMAGFIPSKEKSIAIPEKWSDLLYKSENGLLIQDKDQ